MNESWLTNVWRMCWMRNRGTWMSHGTWVSHGTWMSHGSQTYGACATISHSVDESWHMSCSYEWVMAHKCMTHVLDEKSWHMNESWHMSESWHMNESWHTNSWQMCWVRNRGISVRTRGPFATHSVMNESWHTNVWHICHDSSTIPWRICVPWLVHMCDMTHSHVCHDPCIRVPWLIHRCSRTHAHVCHDSFIRVLWFYVCHDSFKRVLWFIIIPRSHTYEAHIWMSHGTCMTHIRITHMNESWHIYKWFIVHS